MNPWLGAVLGLDTAGLAGIAITMGRQLHASPRAAPRPAAPRLGQWWPGYAALRPWHDGGPCLIVLGRQRCVGTFRILPYIGRLCATCGVPAVVHLLDRRDGDAAEQYRGVRAVRLPYAGRWKGAPSPLAAYVGADGRVAQLSLVDTLLGLAAFAEGCPTAALRKWPWTLQEWTERYSDERHEAARHLADTVAADPS